MLPEPRLVLLVAYDGVQLLDLVGPADIFDAASRALAGQDKPLEDGEFVTPSPHDTPAMGYRLLVGTPSGKSVRASNGLRMTADVELSEVVAETVDTLIVSGTPFVDDALSDQRLIHEIRRISARARRTCSVCSGAFLAAASGVLEGRRATTHWAACDELARRHPNITVEPDRIYIRHGEVATSAGVTAGLDLALALVDEDHGPEIAVKVARWMVMFLQRPGGQSQFSERLALPPTIGSPIRAVVDEILAEPGGNHRIPDLAHRAAMSERHFARVFARETSMTPGRFIERVRVEAARTVLERTGTPIDSIADDVGFGSPETMRRAFQRVLGVGPSAYRQRFQVVRQPPTLVRPT